MDISKLPIVRHDYETKSGYDISETGRVKYMKHKDADIICMSWKLPNEPTKLWVPGMPIPEPFLHPTRYRFAAFNIQFDALVSEVLGKKYGIVPTPLEHQVDIMAVAARFGLPQKLDRLGPALNVTLPKLSTGNALKKLFCGPPYCNPKKDKAWHVQKLKEFYIYCVRDSDCMDEIMANMPLDHLPPKEQKIWGQNCVMNRKGVPVDHPAVKRIVQVCDHYRALEAKKVPLLTDGAVQTIGQLDKTIEWAKGFHVELPNMQAQTVIEMIEELDEKIEDCGLAGEHNLSEDFNTVRDMLLLRQRIGGAAVKKYNKLDSQTTAGRIHDNSRYHGAGTGRTTGGGFQYLNMPRAKVQYDKDSTTYVEAVEEAIKSFYDTTVLANNGNPLEVAKALVRPMIKAEEGKTLVVADWSSIEYILLMWYCHEWEKVKAFKGGEDPYVRFATKLFGVDYDKVQGDQRQRAKPPVLGSGYMLGWRGLIAYADGYGVKMSEDEAQFATNTYRSEHPLVVSTWYNLKTCAHDAVRTPGRTFATNNTRFKVVKGGVFSWLVLTLPSGRSLFYCSPTLVDGRYGDTIKHRGINPKTKQWGFTHLNPQRIIENIIQGLGRDVLTHGYDRVVEAGFTPIGTIYDEIICEEEVGDSDAQLAELSRLMCITPPWGGSRLPLKAEGYVARRYQKG